MTIGEFFGTLQDSITKEWIYVCGNETHVKIKNAKTGQTKTLVNRNKKRRKQI